MDVESMVGELAWLVKDDLTCKHLVLSAEETFIDFLKSYNNTFTNPLELEPVTSYHRMLLHRLADIFGLMHESIGEGDDRHLIVKGCQDSSIPPILVSDVLNWHNGERCLEVPCKLLKREALPDAEPKQVTTQVPSLSFEEREAAYMAARERIFSKASCSEIDKTKEQIKPRSVPVVARRMIAHALGRKIMPHCSIQNCESSKNSEGPCSGIKITNDVVDNMSSVKKSRTHKSEEVPGMVSKRMLAKYLSLDSSFSTDKIKDKVLDKTSSLAHGRDTRCVLQDTRGVLEASVSGSGVSSCTEALKPKTHCIFNKKYDENAKTEPSQEVMKVKEESLKCSSNMGAQPLKSGPANTPVEAAKRMFAQALGIPLPHGSKVQGKKECVLPTWKSEAYDGHDAVVEKSVSSIKVLKMPDQRSSTNSMISSSNDLNDPSRAARRMFAQALGIKHLSSNCKERQSKGIWRGCGTKSSLYEEANTIDSPVSSSIPLNSVTLCDMENDILERKELRNTHSYGRQQHRKKSGSSNGPNSKIRPLRMSSVEAGHGIML